MDKVLIAPATLAGIDGEFLTVLRKAGFELVFPKKRAQLTEPELHEQLTGIRASLAGSEPYTNKILDAHPQLRVIESGRRNPHVEHDQADADEHENTKGATGFGVRLLLRWLEAGAPGVTRAPTPKR